MVGWLSGLALSGRLKRPPQGGRALLRDRDTAGGALGMRGASRPHGGCFATPAFLTSWRRSAPSRCRLTYRIRESRSKIPSYIFLYVLVASRVILLADSFTNHIDDGSRTRTVSGMAKALPHRNLGGSNAGGNACLITIRSPPRTFKDPGMGCPSGPFLT